MTWCNNCRDESCDKCFSRTPRGRKFAKLEAERDAAQAEAAEARRDAQAVVEQVIRQRDAALADLKRYKEAVAAQFRYDMAAIVDGTSEQRQWQAAHAAGYRAGVETAAKVAADYARGARDDVNNWGLAGDARMESIACGRVNAAVGLADEWRALARVYAPEVRT